jgi:hypothetical protein
MALKDISELIRLSVRPQRVVGHTRPTTVLLRSHAGARVSERGLGWAQTDRDSVVFEISDPGDDPGDDFDTWGEAREVASHPSARAHARERTARAHAQ